MTDTTGKFYELEFKCEVPYYFGVETGLRATGVVFGEDGWTYLVYDQTDEQVQLPEHLAITTVLDSVGNLVLTAVDKQDLPKALRDREFELLGEIAELQERLGRVQNRLVKLNHQAIKTTAAAPATHVTASPTTVTTVEPELTPEDEQRLTVLEAQLGKILTLVEQRFS